MRFVNSLNLRSVTHTHTHTKFELFNFKVSFKIIIIDIIYFYTFDYLHWFPEKNSRYIKQTSGSKNCEINCSITRYSTGASFYIPLSLNHNIPFV